MPVRPRTLLVRLLVVTVLAGSAVAVAVLVLVPLSRPALSAASMGSHKVKLRPLDTRSVVYARDGTTVLAVLHAEQDRELANLDEVPQQVVSAILDTEDRNFYHHHGIDLSSMARAFVVNTQHGHVSQGGSTITQQLVKNELLTPRRDIGRKVREAVLAVRLEDQLNKHQILQRYLNTVYFGEGAYGVRAAAERFFGKDLGDLDVGDAALLAAVIKDPQGYSPFNRPDQARARRAYVLQRMVAAHHITASDAEQYAQEPLPTEPQHVQPEPRDYFVEEVKRRLLADTRLGSTYQERYHQLFAGGLSIITTLDPAMQQQATTAVQQKLPESQFTAALVSMDPNNGEVRALVGGPNFDKAKFNLVTQGARQAGSAFKSFTLAAALEAGHSPSETLDATAPCSFMRPGWLKPWVVNNYESGEGGYVSLTDATVHSLNCAYANLVMSLGPPKVVDMAHRLGIDRHLDAYPSITLGSQAVSPLEMVTAYSTLAAEGVHHDPVFVTKVVGPDKKTVFDHHSDGKRVLDADIVHTETSVLQQVVQRGTGVAANIGRPVAGKTGTAEEWHDAWFCGFTPQLTTVVWMGDPSAEVSMYNVAGVRVAGGTYPAQIWSAFMKEAMKDQPVQNFPEPDKSKWGQGQSVGNQEFPVQSQPYVPYGGGGGDNGGGFTGPPVTTPPLRPPPVYVPPAQTYTPPAAAYTPPAQYQQPSSGGYRFNRDDYG